MLATLLVATCGAFAREYARVHDVYARVHAEFGCWPHPETCPTWACAARGPNWVLCYERGLREFRFLEAFPGRFCLTRGERGQVERRCRDRVGDRAEISAAGE